MKVYVVIYAHSTKNCVFTTVDTFYNLSDAAKCYEMKRLDAIKTARDDNPDYDMDIREERFLFRCRVKDFCENFEVRLDQCDVR